MIKYWLTIVEIDTGKTIYENGFYTREGIADELEDWNTEEDYCYEIEEITEEDAECNPADFPGMTPEELALYEVAE